MHRRLLLIGLFAVFLSGPTVADSVRVMSFNIRYGKAKDGENSWPNRKQMVADVIHEFAPDLLGLQECLQFQADFLAEQLEGYTYFGRSRMNSPNEHCGIFFRTDRFVQLAGGHFWLSETPEVPESKSWDSSLPRMATWLLLRDRQSQGATPVLIVNTHFDHRGKQARAESAALLAERVRALHAFSDDPHVIVTGDFNASTTSQPYKNLIQDEALLRDSYRIKHPAQQGDEGTFNGWTGETTGSRIDWILVGPDLKVESADIVRFNRGGRYPSDHCPVTAILTPR